MLVLLQWWKLEKLVTDRIEDANLANKEFLTKGYKVIQDELIKYPPKYFIIIINHFENVENIFNKWPMQLRKGICLQCDNNNFLNLTNTPCQLKR